jgi:hypothetical protein
VIDSLCIGYDLSLSTSIFDAVTRPSR